MLDKLGGGVKSIALLRTEPNGARVYEVRGRIGDGRGNPYPIFCRDGGFRIDDGRAVRDETRRQLMALRQEGEVPTTGTVTIRGIASSTGRDAYGTEMSRNALDTMAAQFRAGVAYAPTHWEREWDGIVGVTRDALVLPVDSLATAADPTEDQFVLDVTSDLDMAHGRSQELVRALEAGRRIGQSIGAWFTEIIWIEDPDGNWEDDRIIVNDLDLDHLAATRTPANVESDEIVVERMRTALRSAAGLASGGPVRGGEPVVLRTDTVLSPAQMAQLTAGDVPPPARHRGQVLPGQIADPAAYLRAMGEGRIKPIGNVLSVTTEELGAFGLAPPAGAEPGQRHVISAAVTDNTVIYQFVLAGVNADDVADEELVGARLEATGEQSDGEGDRSSEPETRDDEPEQPAEEGPEDEPAEDRGTCDGDNDCPNGEACVSGYCASCGAPASGDEPEGAASAAPSTSSEASAEEPHEESEMTPEQMATLAALIGQSEPAPRTAGVEEPPQDEMRTRLARLEADRARDQVLIQRLMEQPVRATGAPIMPELLHETVALQHGDLDPLVNRAREEGIRPTVVRVVENDHHVQRILTAKENPDRQLTKRDLRGALAALFGAYGMDGGFRPSKPVWR